MNMHQNTKPLRDVACSVKNCHFNNCDGQCTAEAIMVSNCQGQGCEGTLCATFIDKKECDTHC